MVRAPNVAEIDLLPGEVALKAWVGDRANPWNPFRGSGGRLYLTNKRVIYSRPPIWPFRPEQAIVRLDDITSCVAAGLLRGTLRIGIRDGSELRFHPFWIYGIKVPEIAEAINKVLQERHLDHG